MNAPLTPNYVPPRHMRSGEVAYELAGRLWLESYHAARGRQGMERAEKMLAGVLAISGLHDRWWTVLELEDVAASDLDLDWLYDMAPEDADSGELVQAAYDWVTYYVAAVKKLHGAACREGCR